MSKIATGDDIDSPADNETATFNAESHVPFFKEIFSSMVTNFQNG
eukprot:IDg18615t1